MKVGEAVDWGFLHICASNLKRRTSLAISPLIHNWLSTCDWGVPRGLYATNLVESTNARGMTSLVRTLKTDTQGFWTGSRRSESPTPRSSTVLPQPRQEREGYSSELHGVHRRIPTSFRL